MLVSWEDAVRALIDDPAQQDLVTACYFDPPLNKAAARYARSAEWTAVQEVVGEPHGIAVDIGAGNGIVSYALARDGWQTIAIEPDTSNLVGAGAIRALAQETSTEIDVRGGYGESLPVGDGEADLIIARQVLHHARDLEAFCREMFRILRPGGRLLTMRDHVISGPGQLQPFLTSHPLHSRYGGENAFELRRYKAALLDAGFVILKGFGSLDSVLNYAPRTLDDIRVEVAARLGPVGFLSHLLDVSVLARPLLKALSFLDRRPGRLVSFYCLKA